MPAEKGNKYAAGNPGGGRESEYREEYADLVFKFCLLGATDKQLADYFDVSEQTINNWKNKHEEFNLALKKGKLDADANVAKSLYHRALGFKHPEVKVFQYEGGIIEHEVTKHYPPDTAAAFIWLKNRQPEIWRDKQEPESDQELYRSFAKWLNQTVNNDSSEPKTD